MNNIDKVLSSLNKSQIGEINRFLSSTQGRQLKNKLTDADKQKLLSQLSKINPSDAQKRLRNMSPEDIAAIIKKL